jgi:hypothetical protein
MDQTPDNEIRGELFAAWQHPVAIHGGKKLCVHVDVPPRCSQSRIGGTFRDIWENAPPCAPAKRKSIIEQ